MQSVVSVQGVHPLPRLLHPQPIPHAVPDDHTLVLILYQHVAVHVVSQRPYVRRILIGRLQS